MAERICSVDGCDRAVGLKGARGWCSMHYRRWRAHGDPTRKLTLMGAPLEERFWSKVDRSGGPDACWPWTARIGAGGYGSFAFDHTHPRGAHRVAFELTHGPIPAEDPGSARIFVLHRCDNRPCCNPAHLFIGTHDENMADMVAKGRQAVGERSGQARLTADEVLAIRKMVADGATYRQAAERFGVSTPCVGEIARRWTWAWLPPEVF